MTSATRTEDSLNYNEPISIAAAALLTNLGALTMLLTPALIGAFTGDGRISAAQAAVLTTAELGGMTAAILLASLILTQLAPRPWLVGGVAMAAAAHLASAFAADYPLLFLLRTMAGLGIGVVYTLSVAALAASRTPDRNFGFSITANQLAATLVLALCSWAGQDRGPAPVMAILFAFTIATGLAIFWFPRSRPEAVQTAVAQRAPPAGGLVPALLALAGTFLFLLGVGSVWPIIGLIARSHGVGPDAIAMALSFAGGGGIAAGVLVALLGTRFGRRLPLVAGSSGIASAMLLLLATHDGPTLLLAAPAIMFFWIFSIPYYLGAMAELDPSGRLAVLGSAMMPFGLAAGQALAAATPARAGHTATIILSAALFGAALAAVLAGLIVGAGQTAKAPGTD